MWDTWQGLRVRCCGALLEEAADSSACVCWLVEQVGMPGRSG
jgi:hypothetical protein